MVKFSFSLRRDLKCYLHAHWTSCMLFLQKFIVFVFYFFLLQSRLVYKTPKQHFIVLSYFHNENFLSLPCVYLSRISKGPVDVTAKKM